jgi:hypothetical protein
VIDHATSPSNRGRCSPHRRWKANLGGQPPEVIVYLQVAGDTVVRPCSMQAAATVACCSVLTEIVESRWSFAALAQRQSWQNSEMFLPAGGSATLAVEALLDALTNLEKRV